MLRKFACATVALLFLSGIALAESVRGLITAVSDTEITITPFEGKGKEAKKGEEQKIKLAKDVKVSKRKGKDDTEKSTVAALKDAVENSKGKFKGAFATVEVNDKKEATEITYFSFRRKKKPDSE